MPVLEDTPTNTPFLVRHFRSSDLIIYVSARVVDHTDGNSLLETEEGFFANYEDARDFVAKFTDDGTNSLVDIHNVVHPHYKIIFSPDQLDDVASIVITEILRTNSKATLADLQMAVSDFFAVHETNISSDFSCSKAAINASIAKAILDSDFGTTDFEAFQYLAQNLNSDSKNSTRWRQRLYDIARKQFDAFGKFEDTTLEIRESLIEGVLAALKIEKSAEAASQGELYVDDEAKRRFVVHELNLAYRGLSDPVGKQEHEFSIIFAFISSNKILTKESIREIVEVLSPLAIPDLELRLLASQAMHYEAPNQHQSALRMLADFLEPMDPQQIVESLKPVNRDQVCFSLMVARLLDRNLLSKEQQKAIATWVVEKYGAAQKLSAEFIQSIRGDQDSDYLGDSVITNDQLNSIAAWAFVSTVSKLIPSDSPSLLRPSVSKIIVDGYKEVYLPEILELGYVSYEEGCVLVAERMGSTPEQVDGQVKAGSSLSELLRPSERTTESSETTGSLTRRPNAPEVQFVDLSKPTPYASPEVPTQARRLGETRFRD